MNAMDYVGLATIFQKKECKIDGNHLVYYEKVDGVFGFWYEFGNGNGKEFVISSGKNEGRTIDGNIFDSSFKRNEPLNLRCNQTIKGWTEAMTLMPEGSVWEIYIPENLAYGEREVGNIKPFSTLIFKVQLIKIIKLW